MQQASNAYVEGTWVDLGWPFGLMIIGVAAYLRRFLPLTSSDMVEHRLRRRSELATFGPAQLITYILLGILLVSHIPTTPTPADGQQGIASRSAAQSPSLEARTQR